MFSVRKKLEDFKPENKNIHVPAGIVIALIICYVGVSAFALGWIARGEARAPSIQTSQINLQKASGQQAAAGLYVGSRNSDHYHYRWCSGAERISAENKIYFSSTEAAKAAGYNPAGNCPGLQ